MNWIRENWFWIVVGVMFIWMHTRMHGGHGGGGGGCGGHNHSRDPDEFQEPSSGGRRDHAEH